MFTTHFDEQTQLFLPSVEQVIKIIPAIFKTDPNGLTVYVLLYIKKCYGYDHIFNKYYLKCLKNESIKFLINKICVH